MIKYDYQIIRDERDETKTYTPKMPKKINDLISIEGPNSTGKSTFLNIIALGLYGRKNKRIKASLKQKLNDLMDSTHQQLTFSFEIKNKNSGITLQGEKPKGGKQEINLYEINENGKKSLSFESFNRKYHLIYDVPDDPLRRLNELAYDLKDTQKTLGSKVSRLMMKLRDIIDEIASSRNPKKIKQFKDNITKLETQLNSQKLERDISTEELCILSKFYHCNSYIETSKKLSQIDEEIEKLRKQAKTTKRAKKKLNKQVRAFVDDLSTHKSAMRTFFNDLISMILKAEIKIKDNYIDLWKDEEIEDLLKEEDRRLMFFQGIQVYKEKVEELDQEMEEDDKLNEINLLEDLINVLEHYATNTEIVIPGINTTVQDFISILRKKTHEFKEFKAKHEFYLKFLDTIRLLKPISQRYVTFFLPKLHDYEKELTCDEEEKAADSEQILKGLETQRDQLQKSCEYHKAEFIKLGVNEPELYEEYNSLRRETYIKPYIYLSERDLEDKIRLIKEELNKLKQTIKENDKNLYRWKKDLERLEEQKEHKYQNYQEYLQLLFNAAQRLEQRLVNEFDTNIKCLIDKNKVAEKLTKEQTKYFNSVAVYLAKKVSVIRHINKNHKVTKIDLINGKVFTKSGKVILLTDFGTGQSQAAYLKGLLQTASKRKIIALIDEVAMMDSSSIKPIFDLLVELYEKGQLLAGVVVQKGEKLKVKPIS